MAKALYGIVSVNSKILFAIFLVTIVILAISEKIIASDVGVPIITGVIGYVLGTKDATFEKLQEAGKKK